MNPHDIASMEDTSTGGVAVVCACGRRFLGSVKDQAVGRHDRHFNIERARASLRGEA